MRRHASKLLQLLRTVGMGCGGLWKASEAWGPFFLSTQESVRREDWCVEDMSAIRPPPTTPHLSGLLSELCPQMWPFSELC
mmetsp:Transcript_94600/g.138125  ORF Transcript_94600/g.138125 Transcript_94600/m.138125 type:complete len:81 (+) Transcript_94600:886-1128(+)